LSGFSKNIENVNNPGQDTLLADSPGATKIVFRPVKMRNIKFPTTRSPSLEGGEEGESLPLSPEYLEIVNFVNNGWSCVKLELEQGKDNPLFCPDLITPCSLLLCR